MNDDEIITIILDESYYVHSKIGPGMLERVYKYCLVHRLIKRGLKVQVELAIPVIFDDIKMECGYRLDILVKDRIVVEIKCIDAIAEVHVAQILTYLRFLGLREALF